MYTPKHFAETRLEVLHQLIHSYPLATLVTLDGAALCADHIPFDLAAPDPHAPFGVLRGHVARANPLWSRAQAGDVLAVFQGPQAYISPAWYEEKALSGKVVPTFNYAVVHAHGPLRIIDDARQLLALLERLTKRHEAARSTPWQVSDAPPVYIEQMLTAIVGIEIPIARLEGKWKISQNRSESDQSSIAAGLSGNDNATSLAMAALMIGR
jgi:transcriptional regulator